MMALTDGIRGCWSPSLGATGRRLLDRSVFGRHASFDGFVAPELTPSTGGNWRGTEAGVALDLVPADGSGTQLWKANVHPREFSAELTLVQWCKLRTGGGSSRRLNVLYWADFADGIRPFMQLYSSNNQTVAIYWGGSVGSDYTFGPNWGTIGLTWKTNDLTYYVNGQAVFQGSTNQAWNTRDNIRMYWGEGAGIATDQSWGECTVFNRKLTAPEMMEIHRRGNGAIGRMLTGQTRRPVYGTIPPSFRPVWARRQNQIIGGGL